MNILTGIKLLESLNEKDLENLSYFCQEKQLKKGETLFNEGDEGSAMYLLKEGQFEISKNIKGKEVVLGIVSAEEVLGEMALFGDTSKRMATAVALRDSTLVTILSFSIKELTSKNPKLLEKIKEIINARIVGNKIIEKNAG